MYQSSTSIIMQEINRMPDACAVVHGSSKYPGIKGQVYFYQMDGGTVVIAEIYGLPTKKGACGEQIFGFHINSGGSCTGTNTDPFADTDGHYNPRDCEHPDHAGDLPPLFGNGGFAWMMVFTERFYAREVMGKTVVIHRNPDDFKTQPSGNAGEMIACGVIY